MDGSNAAPESGTNRIWSFAGAEYDEARRELRVGGVAQTVEARPLDVLQALLARGGEVATRQELLEVVWQNLNVTDQSLTTAVAKLRTALGSEGRTVIEAVHGIGYKIGVPIELRAGPERPRLAFTLRAGDPVPNRPQWCLDRAFGNGQNRDVWLARHDKTGEQRVFKLADTEQRLDALKREAALSRILHHALGERSDLVRVSDWNFKARPYYLESAYGGPDLVSWALARGGLATLPLADRVGMVADIARTVAAAHGVGVLHRDIKPTNILVAEPGPNPESRPSLRLVDFGSGRLTEAARAEAVTVTGLGLTAGAAAGGERISGTLRYMAPEILAGGPPTIAGDVYALGILLYQVIVGDFDRPLAAGWENDVADPLLRDDVAAAASGDPGRRLASAAILADRLDSLDARRVERDRLLWLETKSERLVRKLERGRLRRPWLILAAASLVLGFVGTSVSAIRAGRARDEAQRQAATVLGINQFLTDDLLGRGNPAISGNPHETLMEAAEAAEPMIEQRLARQPQLAALIYLTLTKAFDARGAFDASRKAYDRAETILTQAEGVHSADLVILRLRRAVMEATANQTGSLERCKDLMAGVAPDIPHLGARKVEAEAWMFYAQGQSQKILGDIQEARKNLSLAANIASAMPTAFDPETRFNIRDKQAFAFLQSGRYTEATELYSRLLSEQMTLHGPMHPDTLAVELSLAAIPIMSGHPDLAIEPLNKVIPAIRSIFGPTNRKTTIALSERASANFFLGNYIEAERDALDGAKAATVEEGKTSFDAFGNLGIAAGSECREGKVEQGLRTMREVYETSRTTLGEAQPITQSVKAALAECLVVADQVAEAKSILDAIRCVALGGLTGQPDFCAMVGVLKGAIAVRQGDASKGRELLQAAIPQFPPTPSDPYYRRWAERLLASLPRQPDTGQDGH